MMANIFFMSLSVEVKTSSKSGFPGKSNNSSKKAGIHRKKFSEPQSNVCTLLCPTSDLFDIGAIWKCEMIYDLCSFESYTS